MLLDSLRSCSSRDSRQALQFAGTPSGRVSFSEPFFGGILPDNPAIEPNNFCGAESVFIALSMDITRSASSPLDPLFPDFLFPFALLHISETMSSMLRPGKTMKLDSSHLFSPLPGIS
jgi:hypothetical protein